MYYQHRLDPQGLAANLGGKAEDKFETSCMKAGFEYERATRNSDPKFDEARRGHWDFIVCSQKVDVKGMKRFHRHDPEVQADYICLELRGSGWKGNSGWLQGKANGIAFEQPNTWLIFGRQDLLNWINKTMKTRWDHTLHSTEEDIEIYKTYRRSTDKFEVFVWVPLADVMHLQYATITK